MKKAYLAGFVDGEGCFSSVGHACKRHVILTVGQKDPKPLRLIQAKWGGHLREDGRGFWKLTWYPSTGLIKVIEDIYPHLVVKKRQARLAYHLAHMSPRERQPYFPLLRRMKEVVPVEDDDR